eukprot:CAMPEP_0116871660 /NCGR_PEP_ID=MMETSP0463-20121206/2126_1 /TAXON_ID=181622 /ORGANISM="Strombidinopsis sp, Strain SopsisLIS2011" /LENGTH=47 /DNA_ID= /DNA_START= /DNA_END= /DNA_ORIENTATION=
MPYSIEVTLDVMTFYAAGFETYLNGFGNPTMVGFYTYDCPELQIEDS